MSDYEEEIDDAVPDDSWRPKFIPRGYDKLDKNIYRNIFYSTSTADSFRNPKKHSASTPNLFTRARGDNVQAIHDVSRQKFKPSRAPLYQRTMCAYTQDYVPRPLDGVMINKECYDLFKEKCETANTSAAGPSAKFSSETVTKDSYPWYATELARKAIPPNFKPEIQQHVNKENKLLVTLSQQHKDFPCPSTEHTRTARPEAFKPKYKMHKAVGSFVSGSSYSRDYASSKYDKLWPVKFKNMREAPPPASGYTGKQRLDPDSPRRLVPEEFHIGDVVNYGPC